MPTGTCRKRSTVGRCSLSDTRPILDWPRWSPMRHSEGPNIRGCKDFIVPLSRASLPDDDVPRMQRVDTTGKDQEPFMYSVQEAYGGVDVAEDNANDHRRVERGWHARPGTSRIPATAITAWTPTNPHEACPPIPTASVSSFKAVFKSTRHLMAAARTTSTMTMCCIKQTTMTPPGGGRPALFNDHPSGPGMRFAVGMWTLASGLHLTPGETSRRSSRDTVDNIPGVEEGELSFVSRRPLYRRSTRYPTQT